MNTLRVRQLRNILNTIFIFGALVGMFVYYKGNIDTGAAIIIISMVFKFVETAIRLLKPEKEN